MALGWEVVVRVSDIDGRRVWRYQKGNQNPYISKKNRQHNGQKKKNRQYNGQKKKDKKTNNDLQNTT